MEDEANRKREEILVKLVDAQRFYMNGDLENYSGAVDEARSLFGEYTASDESMAAEKDRTLRISDLINAILGIGVE